MDATAHLSPGWTGLIAPNGGGKSTLLHLIAGGLRPVSGAVRLVPEGARRHLCPQRVGALSAEVQAFGWDWEAEARRWRALLKLDPDGLERWETLSPGERKRWQVGAALCDGPQVLLLDEPTNHLDVQARGLLLEALRRYSGVGLVVSHDRDFLDALTQRTWRLEQGRLEVMAAPFSEASAQWSQEARVRQAEMDRAGAEVRKLKRRLGDKRRQRATAQASMSTRKRLKGPKDSDARSMAAKARVINGEARLSRQVSVLRQQAERASAVLAGHKAQKTLGGAVWVDFVPAPMRRLVHVEAPALCAGEQVLVRDVNVSVERDSHVHLRGPNGSGKTTLLRALVERLRWDEERFLYLPQDIGLERARGLLERVRQAQPEVRRRTLDMVAALGVDPGRLLLSEQPSPGEAHKLAIAWGLGRHVHLLILDEPTNHLDLPSLERLEQALAQYPGALIVVSHDMRFARACTDTAWTLPDVRGGRLAVSTVVR